MPLGTTEIIIIALVIVVLFGAKKLPQAARSVGQSMRIFKAETKGMRGDDEADAKGKPAAEQDPQAPQPAPQQALPPAQQGPQVAPPLEESQGRTDTSR